MSMKLLIPRKLTNSAPPPHIQKQSTTSYGSSIQTPKGSGRLHLGRGSGGYTVANNNYYSASHIAKSGLIFFFNHGFWTQDFCIISHHLDALLNWQHAVLSFLCFLPTDLSLKLYISRTHSKQVNTPVWYLYDLLKTWVETKKLKDIIQ